MTRDTPRKGDVLRLHFGDGEEDVVVFIVLFAKADNVHFNRSEICTGIEPYSDAVELHTWISWMHDADVLWPLPPWFLVQSFGTSATNCWRSAKSSTGSSLTFRSLRENPVPPAELDLAP